MFSRYACIYKDKRTICRRRRAVLGEHRGARFAPRPTATAARQLRRVPRRLRQRPAPLPSAPVRPTPEARRVVWGVPSQHAASLCRWQLDPPAGYWTCSLVRHQLGGSLEHQATTPTGQQLRCQTRLASEVTPVTPMAAKCRFALKASSLSSWRPDHFRCALGSNALPRMQDRPVSNLATSQRALALDRSDSHEYRGFPARSNARPAECPRHRCRFPEL
jgi:hypothetical protein